MAPPNTRVQRTRSSPSAHRSPLTRRPLGGIGISVALAFVLAVPCAMQAEEPIVVAERLSYCGAGWTTAIYESGFAHQRVLDTCHADVDRFQLIRLTKERIETLRKAIAAADFCALPERIKKPEEQLVATPHFDYLVVKIRVKGATCQVGGGSDDLDAPANEATSKRFRQVWAAITALAPEPAE